MARLIISDARYTTQLGEECPGVDLFIRQPGVQMLQAVDKVVKAAKLRRLAIEGDSMTVAMRDKIAAELPKLEIVTTSGLVERLRRMKDARDRGDPPGRPVRRKGLRGDPGERCNPSRPKNRSPTSWSTRCGGLAPRSRFPDHRGERATGGPAPRHRHRPDDRFQRLRADRLGGQWGAL